MKTIAKCLVLLTLLIPAAMFTGCGTSSDSVVATVGDHDITAQEFEISFKRKVPYSFPSAQDEFDKRREILDSMVVLQLLIQGAYEKNIDKLDEIDRVVIANKNNFLLDVLYTKHIGSKTSSTEAEIKEFYEKLRTKVRASHILVPELDTANMLLERLKNGENFDQLAFEYSNDPSARRNKGDLGYFLWGSMVPEFEIAAFAMEVGETSPPIKTMYGYHVIKVTDKIPNEDLVAYAYVKESVRNQMTQRKTMIATKEYFDLVKSKYPVTVETSTCEYLLHKRQTLYPEALLKNLPRNDFDLEQLDRDEKELVIGSYDGGLMTVNEYLENIKNLPPHIKPNLDDYDSLATIIFELKKMDILAVEAIREGLDNTDEYQTKIKLYRELNMADIMKNDSIPAPPAPDDGMIRQYYEENPDEFTNPAQVHIYEILLSDEIMARQLAKNLKSFEQFKSKAGELTERSGKRAVKGDLGFIQRTHYPQMFDLAYKTPIGEIAGPVVASGKYSIFYVLDKIEPQLKDFLGQKRLIADKMTREMKNEAVLRWIDERMKTTDIDIDDDALWSTIDMEKYGTAGQEGQ